MSSLNYAHQLPSGNMRYSEETKINPWQKRECIDCQRGDGKGGEQVTAKDRTEGLKG